jgi:hypothetical protein
MGGGAPEEEAVKFLKGESKLRDDPRLQEFELNFSVGNPRRWFRTERFGRRGLHVYGWPVGKELASLLPAPSSAKRKRGELFLGVCSTLLKHAEARC